MDSDYLNLPDDFVEILHNPNISNKCFMIRLTGYAQERYEMILSRDNMMALADFLNKYLDNN